MFKRETRKTTLGPLSLKSVLLATASTLDNFSCVVSRDCCGNELEEVKMALIRCVYRILVERHVCFVR
jgi:hypothetical protein